MNHLDYKASKTRRYFPEHACDHQRNQNHYLWLQAHFEDLYISLGTYWLGEENTKKLLFHLCRTFNVPRPNIEPWEGNITQAVTFAADGFIAFREHAMTLGVIVHEFCHWYLFHKYRMVEGHWNPIMMRFEAELLLIVANHYAGVDIHREYVWALRGIGEEGKLEQMENENEK